MRALCDAYYEDDESHYRAFLDICPPRLISKYPRYVFAFICRKTLNSD